MKVSHETYVHLNKYDDKKYVVFDFDASDSGYVLVNKQVVTLDIPDDFDPTAQKIAMLNAEKERVRGEFEKRITQIQEQISKLQAISYEVAA